jgi:hypothetical protein
MLLSLEKKKHQFVCGGVAGASRLLSCVQGKNENNHLKPLQDSQNLDPHGVNSPIAFQ